MVCSSAANIHFVAIARLFWSVSSRTASSATLKSILSPISIDESLDLADVVLEGINANEAYAPVTVFVSQLGEVWETLPAGDSPGRPEVDDVDLARLEPLDLLALDPV